MADLANDVFNPEIWNTKLHKELEKSLIYDKWVTREYEGEAKQPGDVIRLLVGGDVEVKHLNWAKEEDRTKFANDLGEPQNMTGSSINLTVNQIVYYMITDNDLSKKLRDVKLYEQYQEKAVTQIKDTMDSYVASYATEFPRYSTTPTKITVNSVLKTIASMATKLYENNVSPSTELKMEVPFRFLQCLQEAYEAFASDTNELLKSGKVTSSNAGIYHGVIFEGSNNCLKDKDGNYHLMMRTKDALGFVHVCSFSEKVRSTTGFSDILRGYTLYDAKVLFPKQGLQLVCNIDTDEVKQFTVKSVN